MKTSIFTSLILLVQLAAFGQDTPAPEKVSLWAKTRTRRRWASFRRPTRPSPCIEPQSRTVPPWSSAPGGGYGGLVTGPEGHGIAQWLNGHGIAGVVLEYRMPHGQAFVPLLDAQRAIRTVRAQAAPWGIDPKRIGIIGFSAGGHLASSAGTHFDAGDPQAADAVERVSCRPDFMVLVYPVISMGEKAHVGSRNNLLGRDATPELIQQFSNEQRVTRETPPTFLAHALNDRVVLPDNSQMFHDALTAHGVATEYLKLPAGGHGLNGYKGPMWIAWQKQALEWLAAQKIIPATADVAPPK
jgi:acetyl esterase/lipase